MSVISVSSAKLAKLDEGRILVCVERHEHLNFFLQEAAKLLDEAHLRYTASRARGNLHVEGCGEIVILTRLSLEGERHRGMTIKAAFSNFWPGEKRVEEIVSRIR